MTNEEALKDLCKMVREIAGCVGCGEDSTPCLCGQGEGPDVEVPDQVIEEMWRRLTHPCWSAGSIAAEMIERTMRWSSLAEKGLPPMGVMEQCSVKDIREITDEEWAEALKQAAEKDSNDLQRLEEGPAQQRDRTLMSKETFDILVQTWAVPDEEK